MKTFNKLFLLTAFFLLGGMKLVGDPVTSTQSTVNPSSNPGECVWICLYGPNAFGGDGGSITINCGEALPNITAPLVPPTIEPGLMVCDQEEEGRDITVSYSWKLEPGPDFNNKLVGVQTVDLVGTPTVLPNDVCEVEENLTIVLQVTVNIIGINITGPDEILICENEPIIPHRVQVNRNIKDVTFQSDNIDVIEVNNDGVLNVKAKGEATITATHKDGCSVTKTIKVKDCVVLVEPKIIDLQIVHMGRRCVTPAPDPNGGNVGNPGGGLPQPSYYLDKYQAFWKYSKGKIKYCDENGNIVTEVIDINERIISFATVNWTFSGAESQVDPINDRIIVVKNAVPTDTLKAEVDDFYSCAGTEIDIFADKTINCAVRVRGNFLSSVADGQEETSFSPNNKFAKLTVHGKPSSITKPQSKSEADSSRERFSVDAYNLSPSFSAVDFSIPLKGTDLRLEMKRTNSVDVTNKEVTSADNLPNRIILGRTWRTNIAPILYTNNTGNRQSTGLAAVAYCNPDFTYPPVNPNGFQSRIIVQDENGSNHSYDAQTLEAQKKTFNDAESALHKLETIDGGGYKFTKKNGTVLVYENVNYSLPLAKKTGKFFEFDQNLIDFHRVKSISDRNGNKLIYQYPNINTLLPDRIYYELHPAIYLDFTYNTDRTKLQTVTDPLGRTITYQYENGLLKRVIRPEVMVFDPETKTDSPSNPTTEYTYTSIDYNRGKQNFESTAHAILSIKDPENNIISMTYNKKGVGIGKTFLTSNYTLPEGEVFAPLAEDDGVEDIVYMTSLTSPDGTAIFSIDSDTDLDRRVTVTDTAGYEWTYSFLVSDNERSFDDDGNVIGGQKFLNSFSRSVIDGDRGGRVMSVKFITDPSWTVNLSEVTDYYGNITKYIYGVRPVTFYRNGVQVTENYDFGKYNQPFQEIRDVTPDGGNADNHLNITKEFGYESDFNQMVRIVDANGNVTTYDIDGEGNRIRELAPLSKTTVFTFENGFKTSVTDADGRTTTSSRTYNAEDWMDTTTIIGYSNELAITVTKKYDLAGNLIQAIDANGNVADNEYDATNALTRTILPPVNDYDSLEDNLVRPVITFKRNRNRQVTGKQDARGNWTLTEYDGMLRPKKVIVEVSANNAEDIVKETDYNAAGNKSIFTDAIGTDYVFEYDAFNSLISETKDPEGLNLKTTYEYGHNSGSANFTPTKIVDPRGLVTLLEYDNNYRLILTSKGYSGFETARSQISYDDHGNIVKTITFNDKISDLNGNYIQALDDTTSGNQESSTIYDGLNRPIALAIDLDGDGADVNDIDDIVTNTFYDLTGNIIIVIDPEGHSIQTEYDGAGRVIKKVVNLDDDPQYGEVEGNHYSIIAHSSDIVTTKTYDQNSNVLTSTVINDTVGAVGNQTVINTYSARNRLLTVQNTEGYISEIKYDLNNNIRYTKNDRGFETITEFDEANRAFRQELPEVYDAESNNLVNPEILTFYDQNSRVVKTIDQRGLVTLNNYDDVNRLTESRIIVGLDDRASAESDDIITVNSYDGNNNLLSTTFKRIDYDPDNQELVNVDLVSSMIYDSLDRPLVTTDPEGFQSVIFYDLVGNKIKLFNKRANALVVGNVEVAQESPQLRYSTQLTFDKANRLVKNTLPEITVARRNILGTVSETVERPYSQIFYQKNNWVDKTVDVNGNETSFEYDNAGRKLTVTNAIGQDISYTYDKSSNILTQTVENDARSGGSQVTSYSYDKRNLLLTETLNPNHISLERVTTYTYDENGNTKTREFPNGDETTYNYDSLDRLISEVYTNAPGENKTYQYNNNGAVVNATDNTGTVQYEYDILGRQIIETKLNTQGTAISVVESVYDKAGNRIRCYFPNDKKSLVSFYDKRNLLVQMKGYHGKILPDDEASYQHQVELTTYSYNASGAQHTCTLPNGQTTTKEYDNANRITSSTTSTSTNTVNIYSAEYKRDAVGNQLQTTETRSIANGNGTRTRNLSFKYDDIYRLTVEYDDVTGDLVENTYIYDLQGNRLSRIQKITGENDQDSWIYTNDLLNRTTAVQIDLKGSGNESSYSYQYDANGNRELRSFINDNGDTSTHTYFYDKENRLTKVIDTDVEIFTASYDYRTRRIAKKEINTQDQLETTAYLYDGGVSCQEVKTENPEEEYNGSNGQLEKQYIRGNGMGGGIGSVLYMERIQDLSSSDSSVQEFYNTLGQGNGANGSGLVSEYYAYNAVGSVVANTDQQSYVIRENDFDAYGCSVREEEHTPNNFPSEFGGSQNDLLFSTKERDFSTGLDYFRFRYYDSVLGKFTTRDPSGYPDGPNNYLYVNNNPINTIDPLGLSEASATNSDHGQFFRNSFDDGFGYEDDGYENIANQYINDPYLYEKYEQFGAIGSLPYNERQVALKDLIASDPHFWGPIFAIPNTEPNLKDPLSQLNVEKEKKPEPKKTKPPKPDPENSDTWLDFIEGFIPIYGSAKDIAKGIEEGSAWGIAFGIVGLVTDIASLGTSSLIKGSVKGGIKAGSKVTSELISKGEETVDLYRSVSKAELDDIMTNGFRNTSSQMDSKWFGENLNDTTEWGRKFFKWDKKPIHVVKTTVPKKTADKMFRMEKLDGIGPGRSADADLLKEINKLGTKIIEIPNLPLK